MLDNDTKVAEGAAAATGAPGDAGGGEDADPEAEQQAAAMEALAALDDESDSDDDNIQRKEVCTGTARDATPAATQPPINPSFRARARSTWSHRSRCAESSGTSSST